MEQTAVEWLVQQLRNGKEFNDELIQQAKEMEKEQIMDAYNTGSNDYGSQCYQPEQYYNETFKSE